MSNYNIGLDRGLNPPEPETHGKCDGCGEVFDYGDIQPIDPLEETWLCNDCYDAHLAKEKQETFDDEETGN